MTSGPRRAVAVVSALALAGGAGLWLSRVPIATHFIDRELAARGVPARYRIADLGLGRQRLTGVVIGDPMRPDLVADWVETEIGLTLSGPALARVRAGRVRVRGRLVDGKLSLGALDRLLPSSTGAGPVALPAIDLALADGRLLLETGYGAASLRLEGQGRVDDGFRGWLGVTADRLGVPACAASGLRGMVAIASRGQDRSGRPVIEVNGPVRIGRLACAGVSVATVESAAKGRLLLGDMTGSHLSTTLTTGRVGYERARAASLDGTLALTAGVGGQWSMATRLNGRDVSGGVAGGSVSAGRATADGVLRFGGGAGRRVGYDGTLGFADADATALVPRLPSTGGPVEPLVRRLSTALDAAARRMSGSVDLKLSSGDAGQHVQLRSARIDSASGAHAMIDGGMPLDWRGGDRLALAARMTLGGGGLPDLTAQVSRAAAEGVTRGVATMAPYAAGAALTLDPVRFTVREDAVHATTRASVSGPLPNGRVDRLRLPLELRTAKRGWSLNPACTPVSVERLVVSGLRVDPARLTLCPLDGALLAMAGGRLAGGARLAPLRLSGALGDAPLRLASGGGELRVADWSFALSDVSTQLGAAERVTRIEAARLAGRWSAAGLAGRFEGGGGQIAKVPLAMSAATGDWRLDGADLRLTGALKVADAAVQPRFEPLDASAVALTLADGAITATGTLTEPTRGVKVADVAIAHRLSSGAGEARLTVPGITFAPDFQPELLTRLTFGVIADVRGTLTGEGRIAWDAAGVTSEGRFSTPGTDLAAAFGPVEGLAGTIRFTDLLALESAPDQVATVKSINPGVPVTDGQVSYQTLANARVRVNAARWPFAGGTLTLEPTLLDFAAGGARRLTFRVDGMDAGQFLQQFDFKNLNATGTFDGVMPMIFDESGGRIEGGRLAARAGGGSLAYVGELTEKELGFWGDLAFQSLRSLNYRSLDVEMNGPLAGEMVTGVRFTGIRQGTGAKSNFLLRRLTRLPIVFNITVRAPFRGLIDSAASFYDPRRLVQRNLQQLIEEQNRRAVPPAGVQPRASDPVPQPKQD